MPERLTWEEIKKQYPEQWLGLTEVEWKNSSNVKSAVVSYTNLTKRQALRLAFESDGKIIAETTRCPGLCVGVAR